ncbi:hypothetical protein [Selenomonas sp. AB3002]|uniref:hypothetical protein n=2 Tax=unclassified Selenomonas TaxID=2637378 RepID=UPI00163B52B2
MKRRTFILGGLGALGMMAGGGGLFVNRPEFGRLPQGARLARMEASPHYVNGQFQNLVPVQVMNEESGENRFVAMAKFLFGDKSELSPQEPLLSHKTDLHELDLSRDAAIWMGHSTFFMQLGGRRILIHPWQEPYQRLMQASQGKGYKLLTPEIGEAAYLDGEQPRLFDNWWERMR